MVIDHEIGSMKQLNRTITITMAMPMANEIVSVTVILLYMVPFEEGMAR
jgi:hypothetical protein